TGESSYTTTSPSGPSGHPVSSAAQALPHDGGGKESRTIGVQRIRDGGIESFSASFRRSARVPPQSAKDHRDSIFSWVTPDPAPPAADAGSTMRIVLVAGLGLLIVLAIAAGVFLSHRIMGSAPPARIGN